MNLLPITSKKEAPGNTKCLFYTTELKKNYFFPPFN